MRLVEKLLEKARNRPRPEKTCMITPFHICEPPEEHKEAWTATLHHLRNGNLETEEKGFKTEAEAEAWAEERVGEDGTIYIFSF